ncbi:MAG: hypothetical protein H7146_11110 [Burkholderiaceae bacterium]|nr:hypothetical protein [Microbacteriaceae bacterium]
MRFAHERLVTVVTALFLALTVAQGDHALVIAGLAALAIAAIAVTSVAVRSAASVPGRLEIVVGRRAHAHREALSVAPAPQHPSTAGRPRTRAPSGPLAA